VEPITVILVDDSPVFIGLVTAFFEHAHSRLIALVGSARTGEEGLRLAEQVRPRAALIDLRLPGMPGLEVVSRLRERFGNLVIVVLSGADADTFRPAAIAGGADAYVSKDDLTSDLIPVLRRAVRERGDSITHGDPVDA
jgi:DNA-binding NarL/FixJ family response regulator